MSRLRVLDLPEPSLAFLGSTGLTVGGVTAGSTCSTPIADFVKNEVAMAQDYSKSAGNCPDANIRRPGPAQGLCAGAGGCSGRKNVVHHDDFLAIQPDAVTHGEC